MIRRPVGNNKEKGRKHSNIYSSFPLGRVLTQLPELHPPQNIFICRQWATGRGRSKEGEKEIEEKGGKEKRVERGRAKGKEKNKEHR